MTTDTKTTTYMHPHATPPLHYYYGPDGAHAVAHAACAPVGAEYVASMQDARPRVPVTCAGCDKRYAYLPWRTDKLVRAAERLLASIYGPLGPVNAQEAWDAITDATTGPDHCTLRAFELLALEGNAWDGPNLPDYVPSGGPRLWSHDLDTYLTRHGIA